MLRLRLILPALALAATSCIDPTHDQAVESLGEEVPGIPQGPTHRAGQPCLTCHGGKGPGSPEMAVGGTVYAVLGGTEGIAGVTVSVTDAKGAVRDLVSNSVGNFYVWKEEWEPIFPLSVVVSGSGARAVMRTTIGRDGGCATCHRGAGDARHMPAVYLRAR